MTTINLPSFLPTTKTTTVVVVHVALVAVVVAVVEQHQQNKNNKNITIFSFCFIEFFVHSFIHSWNNFSCVIIMWGSSTLAVDICSLKKAEEYHPKRLLDKWLDADTVVIGNGPAGIALSALLSGWHPIYNKTNPHPDPHLHEKLSRMAADDDAEHAASLLRQDLGSLADQHFARSEAASAGGHTPFAVLYDCLVRPHLTTAFAATASSAAGDDQEDGGGRHHRAVVEDEQFVVDAVDDGTTQQCWQSSSSPSPRPSSSSSSSCLCWKRCKTDAVSHIVLGDQQIGGSWTQYDNDMLTVSAAEWMDLPGFSLATDFVGDAQLARQRPRAGLYKAYLKAYVKAMGLQHNFRPFTRVTHIEKTFHPIHEDEPIWLLRGTETVPESGEQSTFQLRCKHVVLACGRQQPKLLGVPGESLATADGRVVYSLNSLKQRLLEQNDGRPEPSHQDANGGCGASTAQKARTTTTPAASTAPATNANKMEQEEEVSADCPVVVVGDGISAADAVLHCLSIEQPVLHVVRRSERELRNIQLSRLSSSVYPEYARVYRLMTGRTREVNYRRLLGTSVHSIGVNGGTTTAGTAAATSPPPHGVLLLASSSSFSAASSTADGQQTQQQQLLRQQRFRTLAICIGRQSALPLLKEYLHNNNKNGAEKDISSSTGGDDLSSEFTTRYQSVSDPLLFAIGAIAGDHFVRFLVGGSLCVAQTLVIRSNDRKQLIREVVPIVFRLFRNIVSHRRYEISSAIDE